MLKHTYTTNSIDKYVPSQKMLDQEYPTQKKELTDKYVRKNGERKL